MKHPINNLKFDKAVYWWLISGLVLVASMVLIGGITRLTQSGLSMVEWKPIVGVIPPLNEAEWIAEFDKYKLSPEYKFFNQHFELQDFKSIFFWEYLHRLIGRIIGLIFIFPFLFFWLKKRFTSSIFKKVLIILLLGVLQGFLGWFMVKSGLVDRPHVSHYRLAIHLIAALTLLIFIYNTLLEVKYGARSRLKTPFKWSYFYVFFVLLGIQIAYGAFVAGLKAGKMYNTFPKIGNNWLPGELSFEYQTKGILFLFESPSMVQVIHRWVAIVVLLVGVAFSRYLLRLSLDKFQKNNALLLLFTLISQVILGVFTLLNAVPVLLGVVHQFVAIFLVLISVRIHFFAKSRTR